MAGRVTRGCPCRDTSETVAMYDLAIRFGGVICQLAVPSGLGSGQCYDRAHLMSFAWGGAAMVLVIIILVGSRWDKGRAS